MRDCDTGEITGFAMEKGPGNRRHKPLAELHPDEIRFFASRFIWAANRTGFYTKSGYGAGHHWRARKTCGDRWLPVYPALATDLVEKHLDFDRYCTIADWKSPACPRDDETAFWLGMMAGDYTFHDCFDVDSHDRVGSYGEPTRWHPERNPYGSWSSPHIYRMMPVMRVGLDYFKKLKLFHLHFPGRVWTFSSASLGMYLYRMSPRSACPTRRYRAVKDRLRALRMDVLGGVPVEIYPEPPKAAGSKGHQQRRPCGMDMGVITDAGIVTDPIEQIRIFMLPQTPSFEAVCEAIFSRLAYQYRRWMDFEDYGDEPKRELYDEQMAEIERIRGWLDAGCPDSESLLNDPPSTLPPLGCPISCGVLTEERAAPSMERRVAHETVDEQAGPPGGDRIESNDLFASCDLEVINRTR